MLPGVLAGGRIASREDDLGGFIVVRSGSVEPGRMSFERIHWFYPLICSDVLVR